MFVTDRFVYVHMQKTGGTRIREILSELTDGRGVGRQHGFLDAKPNKLVFGSIRDPLAWYVSLWAFGCEGRGGLLSRLSAYWQYLYANVEDVDLFREFRADSQYCCQSSHDYCPDSGLERRGDDHLPCD